MSGVFCAAEQVERGMEKLIPKVKKALDAAMIPTTAWLPQWILTLFAKQMALIKPAAVQKIWNNIFKEGWCVLATCYVICVGTVFILCCFVPGFFGSCHLPTNPSPFSFGRPAIIKTSLAILEASSEYIIGGAFDTLLMYASSTFFGTGESLQFSMMFTFLIFALSLLP